MTSCFALPAELTIYHAGRIGEELLAWMDAPAQGEAPLCVDAAAVQHVDGAGLQLLLALDATGRPWQLLQASGPLAEACQLMGLSHWLSQTPQEDRA